MCGTNTTTHNNNSHNIFLEFADLEIEIIKYNTVYYSKKHQSYLEELNEKLDLNNNDKMSISGTEARKMFSEHKAPPAWYMRPEISKMIIESIKAKENVFIT